MTRDPSMTPGTGGDRAPVQMFAVIFGIVYVVVGLLGFLGPTLGPLKPDRDPASLATAFANLYYGRLLGVFPVNLLHSIVHLLIGIWGLLSFRTLSGAVGYARGLTVVYLLLAVLGLIPSDATKTVFGLIPIYGHDVWLHAATGLIAAYFGFATPTGAPVTTTTDRV